MLSAQAAPGLPALPTLVAYERPRRDIGFYFVDQVAREAKSVAGIEASTADTYTVRSTINLKLQRAVEEALQEGLSRYERNTGRAQFEAPEANLAKAIERAEADQNTGMDGPRGSARSPMLGCRYMTCIGNPPSLWGGRGTHSGAWRVGLTDGRVVPLAYDAATQRKLAPYDVVLVRVSEGKGKEGVRAGLRVRPMVQGAVIVVENKTGRILAMTGGFSYPLSQLNRVTQAARQPGSALKPLSYLAALGKGVQPNTLVKDEPLTMRPISRRRASGRDYWTPKELRRGLGRHSDLAPRAGKFAQSCDGSSAHWRHRKKA